MKAMSNTLATFLASKQGFVFADLYTISLLGGTVLRYTSADQPVVNAGLTFTRSPVITDHGVKQAIGVQVDGVEIELSDVGQTVVGGVPILTFIRAGGLDGATIKIERAYAPDWATMYGSGPIGSLIRYSGRYSEAPGLTKTSVRIHVASWLELLNVSTPSDVYQASCANTLFDTKCALLRASYAAAGVAAAGATQTSVPSNLAVTAGTYSLGSIVFTSGPNAGLRRTVKTQDAAGLLTLVAPLPAAPGNGNTFTAYPGCDLSMSTCGSKFNNLLNFRGTPFIPVPETAI
jgi:uncharacterized phage protein (TIGR02218 family)